MSPETPHETWAPRAGKDRTDVAVYTFREVREKLNLRHPQTVADLVDQLGLTVKPVPHNGAGKGLDESDVRFLRQVFRSNRLPGAAV